jgi:hypothetical protein
LVGIESEQEWRTHLEGYRAVHKPVGLIEENLTVLIAYQDWKWLRRLIPYENDRTYETIVTPDTFQTDNVSGEVIRELLASGEDSMRAAIQAEQTKLERYHGLLNGADAQSFSKNEVREILTRMAEWIEDQVSDAEEDADEDQTDEDDENQEDNGISVEDRDCTAVEIQQQLAIFGEAANTNWRRELAELLRIWEENLAHRSEQIEAGLRHLRLHRILGPRAHERVALYERQILGTRKALVNALERLQALRLGQPVAAPIAVDVALTTNHEAGVQHEIP